jgi:hypothetical protein
MSDDSFEPCGDALCPWCEGYKAGYEVGYEDRLKEERG